MDDITYCLLDTEGYFSYAVTISPMEPAPFNSIMIDPPALEGTQAARWNDFKWDWDIVDSKPVPPPPSAQPWQIDQERDRRVTMGFVYNGKAFDTASQSQMNDILGKMTDAMAAILIDQVEPDSLRWSDPNHDFAWSAADGSLVPMTAAECLEFTRAAVRRKEKLVAAGLALKAMDPIPTDYYLDSYWPPMESSSKAARK